MDVYIAFANAVLAGCAFAAMIWAATKVSYSLKIGLQLAAGLALFYCFSYLWLAFNTELGLEWSRTLRWVGLMSWPLVWCWLPVSLIHYLRQKATDIQAEAERVVSDDE